MGKLRVFSGKQVCRLLEQHGFINVRQRWSHVLMPKKTESSTITVPVPFHSTIRIGTLQSIIRQSKLPRELFEVQE
ncbi:MAG: type II toxin-antitoxin system HicA family toxin [Sedimentisphaerales bacterium]|nr:type II toxin-antitoxin system HicA family toxin [Sedimentisphaerales bacterium]